MHFACDPVAAIVALLATCLVSEAGAVAAHVARKDERERAETRRVTPS
jgi:hypothetical protein